MGTSDRTLRHLLTEKTHHYPEKKEIMEGFIRFCKEKEEIENLVAALLAEKNLEFKASLKKFGGKNVKDNYSLAAL